MPAHVIVGSGPAGCALAHSLLMCTGREVQVVLLEAGERAEPGHPAQSAEGFPSVLSTSAYRSLHDEGCSLGKNKMAGEGCILGGGSAVNAGYFCSEPHYWEDTEGWCVNVDIEEEGEWNRIWETTYMVACTERVREALHCRVHQPQLGTPFSHAFLDACKNMGMERVAGNLDATRKEAEVGYCGLTVSTMVTGQRLDATRLLDERDPRLVVRTNSRVARIYWEDPLREQRCAPLRARGVELENGLIVQGDYVHLCAGPEATTRILLHSGVGDRRLRIWDEFNIPFLVAFRDQWIVQRDTRSRVDNEFVGKGYHDHPTVIDTFFTWRHPSKVYSGSKTLGNVHIRPAYQAVAFTNDLQLSLSAHGGWAALPVMEPYLPSWGWLRALFRLLVRFLFWLLPGWLLNKEPFVMGSIFVTASFPDHRAELQLKSADTSAMLRVKHAGTTQREVDILARGIVMADRLQEAMFDNLGPSFRPAKLVHRILQLIGLRVPRGKAGRIATQKERQAHVKSAIATLWHPAGGCCAGDCLDYNLCVRGTANVHVAGAAAFPKLPQGNPMAQCFAMGYRLGEILNAQFKEKQQVKEIIRRNTMDGSLLSKDGPLFKGNSWMAGPPAEAEQNQLYYHSLLNREPKEMIIGERANSLQNQRKSFNFRRGTIT